MDPSLISVYEQIPWMALLIPFLPGLLMPALLSIADYHPTGIARLLFYVACLWIVVAIATFTSASTPLSMAGLGLQSAPTGFYILAVVLTIAGFGLFYVAQELAGWLGLSEIPSDRGFEIESTRGAAAAFVGFVVLGPIAEEIIYRGFLVPFLVTKTGSLTIAVLLAVAIFAAVHIQPFGTAAALFIALWTPLVVGLYVATQSILPSLLLHGLNNFAAYVLVPLVNSRREKDSV